MLTPSMVIACFVQQYVNVRQPDQLSFDPATPLYGGDMTFSTTRDTTATAILLVVFSVVQVMNAHLLVPSR